MHELNPFIYLKLRMLELPRSHVYFKSNCMDTILLISVIKKTLIYLFEIVEILYFDYTLMFVLKYK